MKKTEPQNVERIIQLLSKDFVCVVEDIENEIRIKGTHPTGKTLFIDALIRPRNIEGWRNGKKTVFGIEFKRDYDNFGGMVRHVAQAINYSETTWQWKGIEIGKIPILLYPSPDRNVKEEHNTGYFIRRFLGQFNVGCIAERTRTDNAFGVEEIELSITMSESSLWRQSDGPTRNALSHKLESKIGSR